MSDYIFCMFATYFVKDVIRNQGIKLIVVRTISISFWKLQIVEACKSIISTLL